MQMPVQTNYLLRRQMIIVGFLILLAFLTSGCTAWQGLIYALNQAAYGATDFEKFYEIGVSIQASPNTPYILGQSEGIELSAFVNRLATVAKVCNETYSWSPAEGLSATDTATVIASPIETTIYTVDVTIAFSKVEHNGGLLEAGNCFDDNRYSSETATYELVVLAPGELGVQLSADPETIFAGESAHLQAEIVQGVEPYSLQWSHDESLETDEDIVFPSETTTYTVTIIDDFGNAASAEVTVTVLPPLPEIELSSMACFPDGSLLIRFDADQSLEDVETSYQANIRNYPYPCATDNNYPTGLFCLGSGDPADGLLETISLTDMSTAEEVFTIKEIVPDCAAPVPTRPPRDDGGGSSGGGSCYYDINSHSYVCP